MAFRLIFITRALTRAAQRLDGSLRMMDSAKRLRHDILLQKFFAQTDLLGDYEERFCRDNLHVPEVFCTMSPIGSLCRTIGMNHSAIARNQSFRVSHVSIVSRLRPLVTILPNSLIKPLRVELVRAKQLHEQDLADGHGAVRFACPMLQNVNIHTPIKNRFGCYYSAD